MLNLNRDKYLERLRYDKQATEELNCLKSHSIFNYGTLTLPLWLQAPYLAYEDLIKKYLDIDHIALEIGAGSGSFTLPLLLSSKHTIAIDISIKSLDLLRLRYADATNLTTQVCDMEYLAFRDNTFDLVASAGSLSYGDSVLVMNEIYRVLKPGGHFVCVDSLSGNPIYWLNRLVHYWRGKRTFSTLKRIPTIALLESYQRKFCRAELQFFGAFTWISPLMVLFIGEAKTAELSDMLDTLLKVNMFAFKFVMVVQKPFSK